MKKILFTLALLSIVGYTSPVFAQQQINNDGASASELQQQTGSDNIQQNTNAQQASDVSQNAGASVLQNAPNQPLNVIGAPANSAVADAKTDTKWVVLFILLFAVLIGPAVVYLREMQVAEQVDTTKVAATVVPKKSAETEKPQTKKTTQSNQKEKPKKKAKKGTSNKAKRGKKKK